MWSYNNNNELVCITGGSLGLCRIPWIQYPIIYDIRARPRKISSLTGSKGQAEVYCL